MSGPTAGQRFVQTKPVAAKATGGASPASLPITLLTVPAGKTFTLKDASISLALATDNTFAAVPATPMAAFATIQDSNGNTWAETEAVIMAPSQTTQNGEVRGPILAVLPAGTAVTVNIAGNAGTLPLPTGLYVRVGGGISWEPS